MYGAHMTETTAPQYPYDADSGTVLGPDVVLNPDHITIRHAGRLFVTTDTMVTQSTLSAPCPACGNRTLYLPQNGAGEVSCHTPECPRPTAAQEIMNDDERYHVVTFHERTFVVRHPLHERLDNALATCNLHGRLAALDGPPEEPGTYRIVPDGDDLLFTAL